MSEELDSKQTRIAILVGGGILGGILGYVLGNVFLWSAMGMALAVVAGTKIAENK